MNTIELTELLQELNDLAKADFKQHKGKLIYPESLFKLLEEPECPYLRLKWDNRWGPIVVEEFHSGEIDPRVELLLDAKREPQFFQVFWTVSPTRSDVDAIEQFKQQFEDVPLVILGCNIRLPERFCYHVWSSDATY